MTKQETPDAAGAPAKAALKPCPFCGGAPSDPRKEGGGDERWGYNFIARIVCDCGATISKQSRCDRMGWCDDIGQAEASVVDAWNSRAQ